jgi:adenylate cyclase
VVSMVCAGNEDPLLLAADGSVIPVHLEGGPPFCVAELPYPLETLTLKAGETLVLITDGVTEAQNAEGTLFGRDRLLAKNAVSPGSASSVCEQIRDRVREFEEGTEATDDLTVMAVHYL